MSRLKLIWNSGLVLTFLACISLSGCQQEQDVLDIEAPGIDVNVDESPEGLDVDIDTESTTTTE